ncbi:MAG: hypothetical protein KKA73_13515 [Chloroflexi bacterium]|nr:hypothetical protein [Chloroflexota bacterium]MBU1748700.1 hypothetical protein [Chloroflexota bacterium]MBU1877642.1 hypothetical protein [Chloroflexota bacterium]
MHRNRLSWILVGALLITGLSGWSAPAQSHPQPAAPTLAAGTPLHGTAAYDSGWTAIAANSSQAFYHNLGGDTDDYVVDVQLWDRAGDAGVHHWGYGSDFGSLMLGVYWQDLTDSRITIVRVIQDLHASAVRVRIWVVPQADYDSDWKPLTVGQDRTFSHNLGGDPDDYVVDMRFRSNNPAQGVNQLRYGGDRWGTDGADEEGAFWHSLTATSIKAHRNADDVSAAAEVRIRIWRRPSPDYDSDWQPIADEIALRHWLGGPWNDLVVDLQFKDTNDGYGVNQFGYGGDIVSGLPVKVYGAYWLNLTGSRITVRRGDADVAADQVRVRIWASRAPRYDSGWTALGQGGFQTLTHGLEGLPDTYALDVQFKDTAADGSSSAGVNQRYYGGDTWYDHGSAQHVNYGVWWHHLTDESLFLYRFGNDIGADEVRVRLWVAPMPDYDSGWQSIAGSLTLDHYLGGNTDDYVVDLQFLDDTGAAPQGMNHGRYGGDTYVENGATPRGLGAYWHDLTPSSITVARLVDASLVDKVRVRIWVNPSFDYASAWSSVGTVRTYNHNLGLCTDGMVVDMQFQSDSTTYGTHQYNYGGNSIYYGQLYQYGAHWQALTGNAVEVYRRADDNEVDRARVRIWMTPGCRVFLPLVLRS